MGVRCRLTVWNEPSIQVYENYVLKLTVEINFVGERLVRYKTNCKIEVVDFSISDLEFSVRFKISLFLFRRKKITLGKYSACRLVGIGKIL